MTRTTRTTGALITALFLLAALSTTLFLLTAFNPMFRVMLGMVGDDGRREHTVTVRAIGSSGSAVAEREICTDASGLHALQYTAGSRLAVGHVLLDGEPQQRRVAVLRRSSDDPLVRLGESVKLDAGCYTLSVSVTVPAGRENEEVFPRATGELVKLDGGPTP